MHRKARLILATAALVLRGCATGGTRSVDLTYSPSARQSASGTTSAIRSIVVATFVDAREQNDRIGLLKEKNGNIVYVAKGSLETAVADAVAARLAADGYQVARLADVWDPRAGTVPATDADVIVGGVIERFYGESEGDYLWAPTDAEVRLRVSFASPSQARVVGESTVRSSLGGTTASRTLEATLKERFRAAIDQFPVAEGLESAVTGVQ